MNVHPHLAVLQVVVPMLSAPLIVLLPGRHLAWLATVLTSVMAFIMAIALTLSVLSGEPHQYLVGGWPAPYGIELRVDALSALLLLVISGASTLALLAGYHSLNPGMLSQRQPLFYAAWALALAGLSGIVVAADAFNIFVFMEISSLASYVLMAGGSDRRALPAVFKYLILGTIGATFYLIGIGLLYMMTGTLNMADLALRVVEIANQKPVLVAAGFITVGLSLKAALFPLHVWLPNAYTYAPHVVTVFLAACATKVALYVLLRFDFFVFQGALGGHQWQFAYFLMPLALLAIVVASTVAIFEHNLKRLLAWSSVAQIGYIMLGASLLSGAGLTASVLHMFNHGLAKASLFLAVAALGLRYSALQLRDLVGSARTMPWTAAALVIGGLSLIGVPGTAGFISKWYLISAALRLGGAVGAALTAVVVLGSLMAIVYIWRVVEAAYFQRPTVPSRVTEAPLPLLLVTWAAALANVYFGVQPALPLALSAAAAQALLGAAP